MCSAMANEPTPETGSVDGKTKGTWKYDVDYNGSPLTLIYTAGLYVEVFEKQIESD